MLKNYELLYILHPDLEGSSEKITEKVAAIISKAGGEVTNHEDWGKRKLAYKIAKNDFGVYVLVNFTLESGNLPQVEHDLSISEEVMRFMVVGLPEVVEVKKAEKAKKTEAKKAEKVSEVKEETVEPVKEEKVEKPKAKTTKTTKKEVEAKEAAVAAPVEKPKKAAKETKKATEKAEAERMKKLNEKLEEILGE